MSDLTDDQVRALLDGATPGRRVQFHGSYCPEAVGTPFTDWDTSHDMSVIRPDGSRYRLAHYKHASDAYLSQMAPDLARALLDARAELAAAKQREAGLRAALEYYADTFCEGFCKDLPQAGTYQPEMDLDCSGCKARAALAQTPTDPGDGWTWNERLGWIGPDGKPAGRGGA